MISQDGGEKGGGGGHISKTLLWMNWWAKGLFSYRDFRLGEEEWIGVYWGNLEEV